MGLTAIDVILNGIRSTLEPLGIDKEEEKILKEKDERRKEKWDLLHETKIVEILNLSPKTSI